MNCGVSIKYDKLVKITNSYLTIFEQHKVFLQGPSAHILSVIDCLAKKKMPTANLGPSVRMHRAPTCLPYGFIV